MPNFEQVPRKMRWNSEGVNVIADVLQPGENSDSFPQRKKPPETKVPNTRRWNAESAKVIADVLQPGDNFSVALGPLAPYHYPSCHSHS